MKYMNPVVIRNEETLKSLAEDMKRCMEENPFDEPPEYSSDEDAALKKSKQIQDKIHEKTGQVMWEQGGHRIMIFHGHLITLSLSLEGYMTPPSWHLSMGLVRINSTPARVPDKYALAVTKCFFGEQPVNEDNPKQGFGNVRHFFSPHPTYKRKEAPNASAEQPGTPKTD